MILEIDPMCQSKGLYISVCIEGVPEKVIRIAKEDKKVEMLEVPPSIYPDLGDR
jgi:hypothetical protein